MLNKGCSEIYLNTPCLDEDVRHFLIPRDVLLFEFYTISNGYSRIYKNKDGLPEYAPQEILDPKSVSYINLFINGVLQPHKNYIVKKGELRLKTEDIPIKDAPIILQMIKVL